MHSPSRVFSVKHEGDEGRVLVAVHLYDASYDAGRFAWSEILIRETAGSLSSRSI